MAMTPQEYAMLDSKNKAVFANAVAALNENVMPDGMGVFTRHIISRLDNVPVWTTGVIPAMGDFVAGNRTSFNGDVDPVLVSATYKDVVFDLDRKYVEQYYDSGVVQQLIEGFRTAPAQNVASTAMTLIKAGETTVMPDSKNFFDTTRAVPNILEFAVVDKTAPTALEIYEAVMAGYKFMHSMNYDGNFFNDGMPGFNIMMSVANATRVDKDVEKGTTILDYLVGRMLGLKGMSISSWTSSAYDDDEALILTPTGAAGKAIDLISDPTPELTFWGRTSDYFKENYRYKYGITLKRHVRLGNPLYCVKVKLINAV